MTQPARTLPPIDTLRLLAWARTNLEIAPDAITVRVGEIEGRACVWVERPHPEGNGRLAQDMVEAPQFASMHALRTAFLLEQDGQMTIDLLE